MNKDELKLAVAEHAKTAGTNPAGKSAFSELIVEVLQPRHITYDIFSQFMPVVSMNPGDYTTRKIRRGRFRARQMVPGAQHLTDAIVYNNQFTYLFDRLITGTSMNIMEVRNGELGTVDEIKRELRADLVDEVCSKVFNLLTTVWNSTNTPLNYYDATSTGLTSTVLDAAMENLIEKAGNIRAIVGTRRALLNLYSFAGYREVASIGSNTNGILKIEEVLLERFRTGSVSTYNGVPVIEMPQILENRLPIINRKLVRDDVVLLLGEDAGKIALMGAPEEQEHLDTTKQPADWQIHVWQQYGLLVDRPEYLSVIETY